MLDWKLGWWSHLPSQMHSHGSEAAAESGPESIYKQPGRRSRLTSNNYLSRLQRTEVCIKGSRPDEAWEMQKDDGCEIDGDTRPWGKETTPTHPMPPLSPKYGRQADMTTKKNKSVAPPRRPRKGVGSSKAVLTQPQPTRKSILRVAGIDPTCIRHRRAFGIKADASARTGIPVAPAKGIALAPSAVRVPGPPVVGARSLGSECAFSEVGTRVGCETQLGNQPVVYIPRETQAFDTHRAALKMQCDPLPVSAANHVPWRHGGVSEPETGGGCRRCRLRWRGPTAVASSELFAASRQGPQSDLCNTCIGNFFESVGRNATDCVIQSGDLRCLGW